MNQMKKLYIEPSSRCNYNCKMCFRQTWFDETFKDMDYEVFERSMDTMPDSVETVFFGGMGEPLIHPRIMDMIKKAHDLGKRTEIITNGTLLHEENIKKLMAAGIDMIWVSIDSFREEYYDKIQQNGKYKTIINNLQTLNRIRLTTVQYDDSCAAYENFHEIDLGFTFVAMKSNASELSEIPTFAYTYHAQKVNISNVFPSDKETMEEALYTRLVNRDKHVYMHSKDHPEISLPLMDYDDPEVIKGVGKIIDSENTIIYSGTPILRKKRYCKFIEEGNCFVRYDGDVSPCMGLLHSCTTVIWQTDRTIYHKSYGNMHNDNLKEVWESKEYSDFRQRVLDFSFSPCVSCGGCDNRTANLVDCLGNSDPTCGGCLWSEGIIVCP